jgi:hypothetical protein
VLVAVLSLEPAMKAAVLPLGHAGVMPMGGPVLRIELVMIGFVLGIQFFMPGSVLCVQTLVNGAVLVVSGPDRGEDQERHER